jgi:hypothetical protein
LGNSSGIGGIASIHDDVDAHSVLSNSLNSSSMHSGSNGSSSLSSNTKFLNLLSKLKSIKNSTKEDPSNAQLGSILNWILAGYVIFFGIGLVVTNSLPTAVPYYELLNVLLDINVVINELIYAGRTLEFQEKPETNLLFCSFTRADTSKPFCPWLEAAEDARKPPILDKAALPNYPVMMQFPQYEEELKEKIHEVETAYKTIRKPGDLFDTIIQGEYKIYQFVNGSETVNTTISLYTFWNLMGTLSDNAAILAENLDLAEHSHRAWNFLIANRNKMTTAIKDLAVLIPGQSKTAINNTMIFHLIMAIVSVAIGVVVFFLLLVPRIRIIQADREKILRLLLLMPKSNVYDLVHRVYTSADDEEDDVKKQKGEDEDDESEEEEEADEGVDGETQEITVVADRSIGIYAVFAVGLATLTVPIIAHAVYRFTQDQIDLNTVDLIQDLTTLYLDMLIISWQLFTAAVNCHPGEEAFCIYPYTDSVKNFQKYVDEMENAYNSAVKAMQGNAEVIEVFTLPMCFDTPNGLYRCVTPTSPEKTRSGKQILSNNFVSKTYNGYSNLVQNTIRSSRRLAADVTYQYKKGGVAAVRNAHDSEDDFWFLYEIPLMEGEAGINMAFRRAKDGLEDDLRNGIVVANICYAVALGASVLIFVWVFGAVRKSITTETRYNRGVLYMVPHDVLRNTKAMIEYIENLHAGIGGA